MDAFLKEIAPYAVEEMHRSGILASLILAQAVLESGDGESGLAVDSHNLFGIKGTYNGQGRLYWTTEYYGGVPHKVQAEFRVYPSWRESIQDHTNLLLTSRYHNLVGVKDYRVACREIKQDGYATDPAYTQLLIDTIERLGLGVYDSMILAAEGAKVQDNKGVSYGDAVIIDGHVYAPIAKLAQAVGCGLAWDNDKKIVTILK